MSKRSGKTSPATPASDKRDKVTKIVSTLDRINIGTIVGMQLLAGTEVRIVEFDGKLYIPEVDVADGLDQGRGNFLKLLERNADLLNDYPRTIMVIVRDRPHKMRVLSFENTRRAIMMVDHNVKDPMRREFLISRKRQYFQIIDEVYEGKNPQLVDVGSIKDDPKSIQGDNNLRRALFIKKVNETHPSAPNTVRRLHALSHNDQHLVRGPHVPFEAGAHLKYSKEQALKDSAQKMVSFAAIACGKIEIEDINRFEKEVFRGLPDKYIPDYLPGVIETTTQMKLMAGEEA